MRLLAPAVLLTFVTMSPAEEPEKNGVKLSEAIKQLSSDEVGKRNNAAFHKSALSVISCVSTPRQV